MGGLPAAEGALAVHSTLAEEPQQPPALSALTGCSTKGAAGRAQPLFLWVPSPPHKLQHHFQFHLHILLLQWLHNWLSMCLAEGRSLYNHPRVPVHEPHEGNVF